MPWARPGVHWGPEEEEEEEETRRRSEPQKDESERKRPTQRHPRDAGHHLAEEPRSDAHAVHNEVHDTEHVAQQALGETVSLDVLRDHPALEAGEEQGRCEATKDTTDDKNRNAPEVMMTASLDMRRVAEIIKLTPKLDNYACVRIHCPLLECWVSAGRLAIQISVVNRLANLVGLLHAMRKPLIKHLRRHLRGNLGAPEGPRLSPLSAPRLERRDLTKPPGKLASRGEILGNMPRKLDSSD